MGNFRPDKRGFGGRDGRSSSGGFGGGSRGGFGGSRGGFRDRDSGFERRRPEMHEVTCAKCGKQCEVPFKPTGDKPVYCSSCFRTEGDSTSSGSSSGPRNNSFRDSPRTNSAGSGITSEQFNELNTKLDKILGILELIDFEDEEGEESDDEDSEEVVEEAK